jgi:hypothetical protein
MPKTSVVISVTMVEKPVEKNPRRVEGGKKAAETREKNRVKKDQERRLNPAIPISTLPTHIRRQFYGEW